MMEGQEKVDGFEKYEVEGWYDTLTRAREIMGDKKKLGAVKKIVSKKRKSVEELEMELEGKVEGKLKETFDDKED